VASSLNSKRSRVAARPRFGCEIPRIWTPPLRKLTEETSLGFAAIEFAEEVCGEDLVPWQRWLLIHALELDVNLTVSTMGSRGRLDPLFRFRKVVVLVARQNGKSRLSQIVSLFFLYVLGTDLILGTAQDLDTAEEVWDGALDLIEETPELAKLADKPIRVNGKKTIRLLSGERYKVKAANRRAGRGLSGDLILLDELREHQSWDAWGAITKTTMARPAAMIWALSNAGDATSVVLRYLRKQAHAALGDPDGINQLDDDLLPAGVDDMKDLTDDPDLPDIDLGDLEVDGSSLGLFEWSAKPGTPVSDVDGILQANPSTGHCISLRTLLSDAVNDPEWVFRTECLCQWSDGSLDGPFPPGAWDAGQDPASRLADDSPVVLCLGVSWDRSKSHIGLAGRRSDGLTHVEVIASRVGTEWVVGWLTDPERDARLVGVPVIVQAAGAPESSLIEPLEAAGVRVVPWKGADLSASAGAFYDLVRDGNVRHLPQPILDLAAATAVPKMGEGGAFFWDLKRSPVDASPLKAVTGAAHFVDAEQDYDLLDSVR
jgi:hypothetical protein